VLAVALEAILPTVHLAPGSYALIATFTENCKLSDINPHTRLTETVSKLAASHPAHGVNELMPWTAVG